MSELKYPKAVYREQDTGRLVTILAEDLTKSYVLERAKLNKLYDETEQFLLTPRAGAVNQAHFAGKPTGGRRLLKGESDKEHDGRVGRLRDGLNSAGGSWNFGMLGSMKDSDGNPVFKQESTLSGYRWGSEIHRIIDEQTIVRHDVYGESTSLSMSVRQPSIAIEVIKTHYPEEAAFVAFLEKSRREPFIVFFDVIEYNGTRYPNTFVKVDAERRRLCYRQYTYSIREGKVFKGDVSTEITTSARLRIEIEKMLAAWGAYRASSA